MFLWVGDEWSKTECEGAGYVYSYCRATMCGVPLSRDEGAVSVLRACE